MEELPPASAFSASTTTSAPSDASPSSDCDRRHTAAPSTCPGPVLASSQTSASSASLRFPKPEGSHLLAHWVVSSSTNAVDNPSSASTTPAHTANTAAATTTATTATTMPASSAAVLDETSSLADSAYELISSTDGESQDGHGPDSLADSLAGSLDLYPRADDVLSLHAGADGAGSTDEEDEEDETSDEDASEAGSDAGRPPAQARTTPSQSRLYHVHRNARRWPPDAHADAHAIQYAEAALCNPSTQSLSTLDYDSSHGDISGGHAGQAGHAGHGSTPLVQSIEFPEHGADIQVSLDKVSVKHTIREFTEAETTAIAADMGLPAAKTPLRLAATIRQTMSHHCLSTLEPLRVLYVGSDAGFNEVMYKVSSSLLASASATASASSSASWSASASADKAGDRPSRLASTPGIYNIMPISSLGSAKVPEIDEIQLMGVSDYYIQVERCVRADETLYEGQAFTNNAVYSIQLDNDRTYVSVFCPRGSIVQPHWTLPHVAIFYVSGNDDRQAEATRNAAWEFMTRHAVPSIFITHTQTFSRSPTAGRWQQFVDQAAVHLCLESRDPARPMAPERLPIDLASFLNIDARQMNRNLAYLTGLQAKPGTEAKVASRTVHGRGATTAAAAAAAAASSASASAAGPARIGRVWEGMGRSLRLLSEGHDPRAELSRTLGEVGALLRSLNARTLATVLGAALLWACLLLYMPTSLLLPFGALPSLSSSQRLAVQGLGSGAAVPPPQPTSSTVGSVAKGGRDSLPVASTAATPLVCSVPSVVPTVTISFVATETVQVPPPAQPVSSSTTGGGEVRFGGLLTDRPHSLKSQAKPPPPKPPKQLAGNEITSTGCSIQLYSSHEILVRVPAGTKTTWLAKGAIDIDVWRGQTRLKSKLSATDEGLVIEIGKKDAHGVMNVSIVTTRRPKINETFAVDFGQPAAAAVAAEAAARLWDAGRALWQDAAQPAAQAAAQAVAKAVAQAASQAGSAGHDAAAYAQAHGPALSRSAQAAVGNASSLVHTATGRLGNSTALYQKLLAASSAQLDKRKAYLQQNVERARDAFESRVQKVHARFGGASLRVPLPTGAASAADLLAGVQRSVLRAQIASNLWWLRVQGQADKHATYAAKAAEHLRSLEGGSASDEKAEKAEKAVPDTDARDARRWAAGWW